MPTATRPGHVAITAGFYEDPTSVAKGNENYNHLLQTETRMGSIDEGSYDIYPHVLYVRGSRGGQWPPEKSQKYRVSKQYRYGPAFNVGPPSARQRNAI